MLIKQWESVWRWSGKHGYDDNVALETIMSVGDGNEAKKCTPSQRLALSPGESERPTPNWPTFSCKFHSGAIFSFISRTVMKNYFAKALRLRFCRCATGKQWKFINTLSRVLQRGDDDGVLTSGSVPAPKLNSKSISDFLFFCFARHFLASRFHFANLWFVLLRFLAVRVVCSHFVFSFGLKARRKIPWIFRAFHRHRRDVFRNGREHSRAWPWALD